MEARLMSLLELLLAADMDNKHGITPRVFFDHADLAWNGDTPSLILHAEWYGYRSWQMPAEIVQATDSQPQLAFLRQVTELLRLRRLTQHHRPNLPTFDGRGMPCCFIHVCPQGSGRISSARRIPRDSITEPLIASLVQIERTLIAHYAKLSAQPSQAEAPTSHAA